MGSWQWEVGGLQLAVGSWQLAVGSGKRKFIKLMSVNDKIKFAVMGLGHIGKRHAEVIRNNSDCELVALCDNRDKADLDIAGYPVPFFSSLDELLKANMGFEVLCIATPNGLHEANAIKGLRAGCHVVVEKPMAITSLGCERIIRESLAQQRRVFCVMQNRFSPLASWLKKMVSENALGNIYMVQINCYWNRDERYYTEKDWRGTMDLDGGVLFTQFSHFIDLLHWVFGGIENISSRFANFTHGALTAFDDSGIISFDLTNGGMGSLNFSTAVWNRNLESSITVIAERGTVKVGGQYMDELLYCDIRDHLVPELGAEKKSGHCMLIKNVVEVLRGQATMAILPEEGLRAVEMVERIYGR